MTHKGIQTLCNALNHPNVGIIHLHLVGNDLGAQGGKIIGRMLKENTTIRILNLFNTHLGNEGVRAISKGIETNTTLATLFLQKNEIKSEGMKYLCESLRSNRCLNELHLGLNEFGDEGARYVANMIGRNSSLGSLSIPACGIGVKGSEVIFDAVEGNTSLAILRIICDNELGIKCAESLRKNKYLLMLGVLSNENGKDMCGEIRQILGRNYELWNERIHWSCVLNVLCRVMILGDKCGTMPLEMIYYILTFVPRDGMIRGEEMRRVIEFSTNISSLGREKHDFLRSVLGNGIHLVNERVAQSRK